MTKRLDGKAALITGAGSGIGLKTALLFAREGAAVAVCDRDADAGRRTASAINEQGGRAIDVACDVTVDAEVQAAIARCTSELGGLHVLFNNAGIFPEDDGSPVDTPIGTWEATFGKNS